MGAVLNVMQPSTCGIGGDLWVLYYDNSKKKVHCIDGSGKTPALFTPQKMQELGFDDSRPPTGHAINVSVPGAVAAWCDLYDRFGAGNSTLLELLTPAINLARKGFTVSETSSFLWRGGYYEIAQQQKLPFPSEYLDPDSKKPPKAGKLMRNPDLATTMEEIGKSGKKAFYEGRIAQEIVNVLSENNGILSLEDLASHETRLTEALSVAYKSEKLGKTFRVWETPLNTQAIVALESLKILEAYGASKFVKSDKTTFQHAVLEALKMSFRDLSEVWRRTKDGIPTDYEKLLSEASAKERSALIDPNAAKDWSKTRDKSADAHGDTTYFSVVDKVWAPLCTKP